MACFPAFPFLDGLDAACSLPDEAMLESLLLGDSPDELGGDALTGPSRLALCASRGPCGGPEQSGCARGADCDAGDGSCDAIGDSESSDEDAAARGAWRLALGGSSAVVAGTSPPPALPPCWTGESRSAGAPFSPLRGAPGGLTSSARIASHAQYRGSEYGCSVRAPVAGAAEPLPLLYPLASSPPPVRTYDGFAAVSEGSRAAGDTFRAPSVGDGTYGRVPFSAPCAEKLIGTADAATAQRASIDASFCSPADAAAWPAPATPAGARPAPYDVRPWGAGVLPFPAAAPGAGGPPPRALPYPTGPAAPLLATPPPGCGGGGGMLAFAPPAPACSDAVSPRDSSAPCMTFVATPSCASAPHLGVFDASSPSFSSAAAPFSPAVAPGSACVRGPAPFAPPPPFAPRPRSCDYGADCAAPGHPSCDYGADCAAPGHPLCDQGTSASTSASASASASAPVGVALLPSPNLSGGGLPGLSVRVRAPDASVVPDLAKYAPEAFDGPGSGEACRPATRRAPARGRPGREGGSSLCAQGGVARPAAPGRRRRRRRGGAFEPPPLAPDVIEAALRISAPVVSGISGSASGTRTSAAATAAAAAAAAAAGGGVYSLARVVTSGGRRSHVRAGSSAAERHEAAAYSHAHGYGPGAMPLSGSLAGPAPGGAGTAFPGNPSPSISSGGLCSGSGRTSSAPSSHSPLSASEAYASALAAGHEGWISSADVTQGTSTLHSARCAQALNSSSAAMAASLARPSTPTTPVSHASPVPRPSTDSAATAFAHPAGQSPLSPTSRAATQGTGSGSPSSLLGADTTIDTPRLVLVDPAVASALMLRLRTPSQRDSPA